MKNEYTVQKWNNVDRANEPNAFIDYLDAVSALETVQFMKQQTFEFLQIQEGQQLLDIGCGTGIDAMKMAERAGRSGKVVGVDISKTMIDEANRRFAHKDPRLEFHVANAQKLDFPDNSFDACRADRILVHLENPSIVLAEMLRVARQGARIVVLDADWETLAVDAPDKEVTRKIFRFLCDSSGSRWIGRQLRRHFIDAGLHEVVVVGHTLTITDLEKANQIFKLQETAYQAEMQGIATSKEIANWINGLEQAQKSGKFFSALTFFCASGRKYNR
jgi:ubiquinone/menaquinone biosynthesis C-methylase UbiE